MIAGDALTARQEEILAFIRSHIGSAGYAPSVREIGDHFGIRSTNGVNDHLIVLEKKGAIKRGPRNHERAIRVLVGPCALCGGHQ